MLHVGCGTENPEKLPKEMRGPDWHEVRLDIDPAVGPDIVASIADMSVVDSETVDAVLSSHNLEHVFAHEVPGVLEEFRRVLRPLGQVLIAVPDLAIAAKTIVRGRLEEAIYRSPAGPISALDMLYGHGEPIANGQHFMAHRTGFTRRSLAEKLRAAGFVDVVVVEEDRALLASARRPR
ncbi:Methyltransferase type 11 [Conexibacter woesei DSM 14684]|uniref:Methyltransferase type 11 n=1 Tax=Conexibacter woesei (strain DSM 14684 / CCUG 47730 / CIP 108061 / JCM 11494 / NBRC 100937 / ID131577) TaxID=469383 RepID=D3FFE7_CONWI|nr:Methyltransferase type 11 [Conexibacter woesei DSM 14684]